MNPWNHVTMNTTVGCAGPSPRALGPDPRNFDLGELDIVVADFDQYFDCCADVLNVAVCPCSPTIGSI